MHIEKHAKKTTKLMMDLMVQIEKIKLTVELRPSGLSNDEVYELVKSYENLNNHLFSDEA